MTHGELWKAREKDGKKVRKGKKVKVVGKEGMMLIVEKLEEEK